jgi:hypothetical protein
MQTIEGKGEGRNSADNSYLFSARICKLEFKGAKGSNRKTIDKRYSELWKIL